MEWTDYREALTRGLWLMAVLAVAGLVVGVLLPKGVVHPMYVTTTSVGAPPSGSGSGNSPIPPGVTTDQIQYYADTDAVYAKAGVLAHLKDPQYVLRGYISLAGPCDNCGNSGGLPGIVQVNVKAPTAVESADLNVAFDTALQDEVNNGAKALNNGEPVNTGFEILQSTEADFAVATKTAVQTFDSRPIRAASGAAIGLILGILLALVRGLMDKRVSSARRAQGAMGYPVVAEIPAVSSESSEAYRMLWLSVFREPLPDPVEQGDSWLDGVDLMSDSGTWPGLES
jgi:succinoglycan biosynthesis transport protein ExoP